MSSGIFVGMAIVIFVAAFVQGSTGFGFALIAAPIVGLMAPRLLPVLILVLLIPLNLYVAWRERHALDMTGATWIIAGRIAGTFGGLWLLLAVPVQNLNLLVGIFTMLAASASLISPSFAPGRRGLLAVGVITGVSETATGIGGPPLALAYQHRPAAVLRPTVAICFLLGEAISLAALTISSKVDAQQVRVALLLVPVLGVGALFSSLIHRKIDGPRFRMLVLGFALLSGIIVTIRGW